MTLTPTRDATRLYVDALPRSLRLRRFAWLCCYQILFRTTPAFAFRRWRLFLLRAFGAQIGAGSKVAPSCFVWAPWNLRMGVYACLADGVDCYSVAPVEIGDYATVSQRSFLCTATHDISRLERPLVSRPIAIADHAWVAAEAFIGPGVAIGEGAVVGARSVVTRDVPAWTVVAGNPARALRRRTIDAAP